MACGSFAARARRGRFVAQTLLSVFLFAVSEVSFGDKGETTQAGVPAPRNIVEWSGSRQAPVPAQLAAADAPTKGKAAELRLPLSSRAESRAVLGCPPKSRGARGVVRGICICSLPPTPTADPSSRRTVRDAKGASGQNSAVCRDDNADEWAASRQVSAPGLPAGADASATMTGGMPAIPSTELSSARFSARNRQFSACA